MKLRQLQFAKAIAETGSFSQAADYCCATQPTLSNALAQLEEELGGKLFTRTTRQVELTDFGRYLLPYLAGVLDSKLELERAAEIYARSEHRMLRIGFSPLVDMRLVNSVLKPFKQSQLGTEVFFKECLLDDLSNRLENGSIDLAIVPAGIMSNDFERASFYEDQLYYLPQDDHLPQPTNSIRLTELPRSPLIMTGGGCGLNGSLQALFDLHGQSLEPYPGQALSYQIIEEWSELGIGAGILPKAKLSNDNTRKIPLFDPAGRPLTFRFNWIYVRDWEKNSILSDFNAYLENTQFEGVRNTEGTPEKVVHRI